MARILRLHVLHYCGLQRRGLSRVIAAPFLSASAATAPGSLRLLKQQKSRPDHRDGLVCLANYLNVTERNRYSPTISRISGYVSTISSERFWFSSPHFSMKASYFSLLGCMSAALSI